MDNYFGSVRVVGRSDGVESDLVHNFEFVVDSAVSGFCGDFTAFTDSVNYNDVQYVVTFDVDNSTHFERYFSEHFIQYYVRTNFVVFSDCFDLPFLRIYFFQTFVMSA